MRGVVVAMRPTAGGAVLATLLRGFGMNLLFVTAQASLGDLFRAAPKLYGKYVSLFMMMAPLSVFSQANPITTGFPERLLTDRAVMTDRGSSRPSSGRAWPPAASACPASPRNPCIT